mgnify:CR=1 FL=1
MNEEQVADIWMMFKEYCDKKQIELVAEKYIDLLADYGIGDDTLKEVIGTDNDLDNAVSYYLDIDADGDLDEEEEWDE